MPRLTVSKDDLKGGPLLPEGLYTVRLDGFKPSWSKNRGSVNLNPQMKIINHLEHNDRPIFENLNSKGHWVWPDFHHAFGVTMPESENGSNLDFVGFDGPEDEPDKWTYNGPLLGQVGQVYIIQADNTQGGVRNSVKYYVCRVPNCHERHSQNLAK